MSEDWVHTNKHTHEAPAHTCTNHINAICCANPPPPNRHTSTQKIQAAALQIQIDSYSHLVTLSPDIYMHYSNCGTLPLTGLWGVLLWLLLFLISYNILFHTLSTVCVCISSIVIYLQKKKKSNKFYLSLELQLSSIHCNTRPKKKKKKASFYDEGPGLVLQGQSVVCLRYLLLSVSFNRVITSCCSGDRVCRGWERMKRRQEAR